MIKSVSNDQTEILRSILSLNNIDQFECDLTYGNGSFYKDIPEPHIKIDLDPQKTGVTEGCSTNTFLPAESTQSVVFDPPFLTYVRQKREGNGSMVMAKRFSGYWRYDELEEHYRDTLKEAARILQKKGILVFKCQDIVHNHKLHATHINIVNWASELFRLKDLFILAAKHRMPSPNRAGKQKHARIFHSYFLVLEKIQHKGTKP